MTNEATTIDIDLLQPPALGAAQIADLAAPTADGVWAIQRQKVAA